MRKNLFRFLVSSMGFLMVSGLLFQGFAAFAQDGPVSDPDAGSATTVEVDVPSDSASEALPEGGFALGVDTTPPTIMLKVLPQRPTAGRDVTSIEISTENFKTNELTEGVFIEVTIAYPKKRFLLPTSAPILEGTDLFYSEFTSKQGVVLLENIMFPIRGKYDVTVKARAIDGLSFEPITETFSVRVGAPLVSWIVWLLVFAAAFFGGYFLRIKKGGRR